MYIYDLDFILGWMHNVYVIYVYTQTLNGSGVYTTFTTNCK